jgi:hypothetical protein
MPKFYCLDYFKKIGIIFIIRMFKKDSPAYRLYVGFILYELNNLGNTAPSPSHAPRLAAPIKVC